MIMAAEHVERGASEEVAGGVEVDAVGADTCVGDRAVQWIGRIWLRGRVEGDVDFEVH